MLPIVVSMSFAFIKKRRMMEIFPPAWRKSWESLELQVMVVTSLTLQIILTLLGSRRKYNPRAKLRAVIWFAYLTADSVAIYALGIISSNLGETYNNGHYDVDANGLLSAFWAPLLLLHLGGPDTITAYALEDNELWLRHLLALFVQTAVTLYIFLMAWNGSTFSLLSVVMIVCGFIKYGERVWVLWSSSSEKFRDSIPDPRPSNSKIMQECRVKQAEGYHVTAHEVIDIEVPVDLDSDNQDHNSILAAYTLLETFKRLFTDLILSSHERDISRLVFKDMSYDAAFKVIEIELGFMYDLLYTKTIIVYTRLGLAGRITNFALTCFVLVFFTLAPDKKCSKVEVSISYLLLAVAILLEIYAVLFVLLFSDQTAHWLIKHCSKMSTTSKYILKVINRLQPLSKRRRWSNSMAQYNILSFSVKEKPLPCHAILECFHIAEYLEKYRYRTYVLVSDYLKLLIYDHLKDRLKEQNKESSDAYFRDQGVHYYGHPKLAWSTKMEFDLCILVWHIATEICCQVEDDKKLDWSEYNRPNFNAGKCVSRYMLYLLVMHPSMLPIGIGQIRFRDTYAEVTKFFQEQTAAAGGDEDSKCFGKRGSGPNISEACNKILKDNTEEVMVTVAKGDRGKFVLFHACKLASEINRIENIGEKWSVFSQVWVEMLIDAACKCRGSQHTQQLRRGGELLTHVWLLMAHLGLTDHFQIHGRDIAERIIR